MAYAHVYDISAPLDTSAANLIGQDIRFLTQDIMQRVASFGAGLLAARPTPETTSATADWTGVMYWATDTQQVFRWSGAAWVDISASIPNVASPAYFFSSGAAIVAPVDTVENTIYSGVVPANLLGAAKGFKYSFNFTTALGGTVTVRVKFGGSIIGSAVIVTSSLFFMEGTVLNITAGTQSDQSIRFDFNVAQAALQQGSVAIDTTVNQTLLVTAEKTNGADAVTFHTGYAKLL